MANQQRGDHRDSSKQSGSDAPKDDARKPWGDVRAPIPKAGGGDDVWLTLGPVWETDSGGFSFVLELMPVAWNDSRVPRRIVLVKRQPRDGAK